MRGGGSLILLALSGRSFNERVQETHVTAFVHRIVAVLKCHGCSVSSDSIFRLRVSMNFWRLAFGIIAPHALPWPPPLPPRSDAMSFVNLPRCTLQSVDPRMDRTYDLTSSFNLYTMAAGLPEEPRTKLTTMLEDKSTALGAYARLSNIITDSFMESTAFDTFFANFSAISKPPLMSWGYFILASVSTIFIRKTSSCWFADIIYDNAVDSSIKNCRSNR